MRINIKNIAAATLLVLALLPLTTTARERKTPKADFELPKAGDFSIGIDALPIINFAGNIFNNTASQTLDNLSGSSISFDSYSGSFTAPTVSLLGRYMLTDKFAVRVNLGIIVDTSTDTTYTDDDAAQYNNPLSEAEVVDKIKSIKSGASIAAGIEYRIGKGRVQGVFSGNALYMYSVNKTKYTYGNAMTSINQTPSISYGSYVTTLDSYIPYARVLSNNGGATHTIGLMATAGIEWFVASRISLGFEVDFLMAYSKTRQQYNEYEGYNIASESIDTYIDTISPSYKEFFMSTGCFGSNLTVNFYF